LPELFQTLLGFLDRFVPCVCVHDGY